MARARRGEGRECEGQGESGERGSGSERARDGHQTLSGATQAEQHQQQRTHTTLLLPFFPPKLVPTRLVPGPWSLVPGPWSLPLALAPSRAAFSNFTFSRVFLSARAVLAPKGSPEMGSRLDPRAACKGTNTVHHFLIFLFSPHITFFWHFFNKIGVYDPDLVQRILIRAFTQ
jgi:hypothetical protein